MTCIRIEHGFICGSPFFRLPLADGTRVFMSWHNYLGPIFFRDRYERREIENWYENPRIIEALDWFCNRGHRA